MVLEGSRSPLHPGPLDPLYLTQDKSVDPLGADGHSFDCPFPGPPCQNDRGLYYRVSPERLWSRWSLYHGQRGTTRSPPDSGEFSDPDPLHSLYCPILHDDQGERPKKGPLDVGRDLSRCLWSGRSVKSCFEVDRNLMFPNCNVKCQSQNIK